MVKGGSWNYNGNKPEDDSINPKKTNFDNEILNDENNFIWQTVELTKGLFWPLDVHASYSYNNQTKLLKWHGMLQYSFSKKRTTQLLQ